MPFVNEKISPADRIAFDIDKIDARPRLGKTLSNTWTVDKSQGVYLRRYANGVQEESGKSTWHLLWRGKLIEFDLVVLDSQGPRGGSIHGHKRIVSIDIPEDIESERSDILDSIYQALLAYKDGGYYSTATSYTLTLDH